jgi:hypothetical protein
MAYGTEPEREVYRERMRGKFGVEPVFYSYDKNGPDRHGNLVKLLNALAPARLRDHVPSSNRTGIFVTQIDPSDPEKGRWGGILLLTGDYFT